LQLELCDIAGQSLAMNQFPIALLQLPLGGSGLHKFCKFVWLQYGLGDIAGDSFAKRYTLSV
jgi:hypothetical protein